MIGPCNSVARGPVSSVRINVVIMEISFGPSGATINIPLLL